jgi:D-aminopeptidase
VPHSQNHFQEKVPAGVVVGNGFGKMIGSTQIIELGEIETPIILTNTLAAPRAADAILDWTLAQPGNEKVESVTPVVGETNDGKLNNIRRRILTAEMIYKSIESATDGEVPEGNVGAGTGTVAFGFKGGIGTSSRVLPEKLGGYTVGILVQTNFGGVLQILGLPVGKELGQYYLKDGIDNDDADGSIMIVLATDAPLSDRNLTRLASRALAGLARTGASMTNRSGDYVIAFSSAEGVRRTPQRRKQAATMTELSNDRVSPLFQASIEAAEEAIYNSLFMAESITGYKGVAIEAIPLDKIDEMMQAYGRKR